LSPALKARLEKLDALEANQTALLQQVKTAEGRVAAMQREFDVAKNAAKAVGDAPTAAQIAAAKGSTEKWDSLKTDFPEWADATEQFVKAQLAGLTPSADARALIPKDGRKSSRSVVARCVPRWRARSKRRRLKASTRTGARTSIPMASEVVRGAKPEVKALARSDKGRDAIRMLDLYQEALAKPADKVQQERANKLAAAVSSKPGSQVRRRQRRSTR
jgi:hypothetical protein